MIYLTDVGAFDEASFRLFEKEVCDAHVVAYNLFCKDLEVAKYHNEELARQEKAREYW